MQIPLSLLLGLHSVAVMPWAEYRQIGAEFFGFLGEHLVGREDIRANGAVGYVMQRFHQILQRWVPTYQKARFASTILWSTSVGLFTVGNAIAQRRQPSDEQSAQADQPIRVDATLLPTIKAHLDQLPPQDAQMTRNTVRLIDLARVIAP